MDSEGYFTLNTGDRMPAVGLGTWQAVNGEGKIAVSAALEAGYRMLDCAHLYGNEVEVGEALQQFLQAKEPEVKRQDLFITSKIWCTTSSPKRVAQSFERSLSNLNTSYLDMYLLHWPLVSPLGDVTDPPQNERKFTSLNIRTAWASMEELVEKKLVKAIGLSNFNIAQIDELLKHAKIVPAVNQVELHPFWRQDQLLSYCKSRGIHVSAHTPLGIPGGPLSPNAYFPSSFNSSSGYSSGSDTDSSSGPFVGSSVRRMDKQRQEIRSRSVHTPLLKDAAVKEVAKKLGKTPTQVVLRWGLQRGTSVLPKSVRPDKIRVNLDLFDWSLSQEDWEKINSLEPQVRLIEGTHSYLTENSHFQTLLEEDEAVFDKMNEG